MPNDQGSAKLSFWETLSSEELEFSRKAAAALKTVKWAAPLIDHVRKRGNHPDQVDDSTAPSPELLSDLFELRFAYALARNHASPTYEHSAGVGNSTIDFRVEGSPPWLIELVSVRATDAVKEATIETSYVPGVTFYSHYQDSSQGNEKNSLAYEMIVAQQKIGEKVLDRGRVTKFPELPTEAIHAIVVDLGGFDVGSSDDELHWLQMALGPQKAGDLWECPVITPDGAVVRGLFEKKCQQRAAPYVRERIHFLGFVHEKRFEVGELETAIHLFNNPFLLPTEKAIRKAIESWPFIGTPYSRFSMRQSDTCESD